MRQGWGRAWRVWAAVAALLLWPLQAAADSWEPPTKKSYFSADKQMRLTVKPRTLTSSLDYFEDKVAGREPAGQQEGGARTATGLLERKVGSEWRRVWAAPLVNEVAPVSALVADTGRYTVTFDNWHRIGLGDNVVVIYDKDGRLIRSLTLLDFLPMDHAASLPRSVSSLYWGGEPRFSSDGARLVLDIVVPGREQNESDGYVPLEIELATGTPLPASGPGWDKARAAAAARFAEIQAEGAELVRRWKAPLTAPRAGDEQKWHGYLQEAFFRLDPDWETLLAPAFVLRARSAPDYGESVTWLREALLEEGREEGEVLMFGSPQDDLAGLIVETARRVKAGALRGVRIYVTADDAASDRIRAALAHTGARIIQIDPAEPIAQPDQRLKWHRGATFGEPAPPPAPSVQ